MIIVQTKGKLKTKYSLKALLMSIKRRFKKFVTMAIFRFFRRSTSTAFSTSDTSSEILDVDALIRVRILNLTMISIPKIIK